MNEQAWFWSERWQRLEREVQDDIEAGKQKHFDTTNAALNFLHKVAEGNDAKDAPSNPANQTRSRYKRNLE